MRSLHTKSAMLKIQMVIMAAFLSLQSKAQDGLDIDVDLDGNDSPAIFENPLFWIGVAVVVILVAILMRGKK